MMSNGLIYFLYPVSLLYAVVVFFRNLFFDLRFIRTRNLPVPVISVGNITTGGTGKTPAVEYIAGILRDEGFKVVVISRGYKRSTRGFVLVSDGSNILADSDQGGDEPVLLAKMLPGVVVAVHENRFEGGNRIVRDLNSDVILLDDGFQHRSLSRNLNIVLINASQPDHLRAHLPVGRLRESLRQLRRADVIIITKYQDAKAFEIMESLVYRHTAKPVIGALVTPVGIIDVFNDRQIPVEDLVSRRAFLFSGIAQPEEFVHTVRSMGVNVAGIQRYRDHYRYREGDIGRIIALAEKSDAEFLLTTEKDAIRLNQYKSLFIRNTPLYTLRVSFSINARDEGVLKKYIQSIMNRNKHQQKIN